MKSPTRNTPNRLEKGPCIPKSPEHVMKYMTPAEGPVLQALSTGMLN